MVACDWLRSCDFFIQSKTARKKNYCCLVPSRLKISDYFLYSTVFCVTWKRFFKGNFLNKQSQNTKQVGVLRKILGKEFWRGASKRFSKTGRLFALTGSREEVNQNAEISPLDGERRRVCSIVWCDGFSLS